MKLKALSNINSGQHETGDVFDIADDEGQQLVDAGAAQLFDGNEIVEDQAESSSDVANVTPEVEAPVEVPAEAPVTPAPLEGASDSSSEEVQVETPKVVQPNQPTPEQITQDLAASESSSDEVRIS